MLDAATVARLADAKRTAWLASLNDAELSELEYDWSFWSRADQRPPAYRSWRTWLVLAGRGFGKTRAASEWVRSIVCGKTPMGKGAHSRIAVVAETAADARDVLVEGPSGILAVHPPEFRPLYEPSKRRVTWKNGAIATLFNAVEPDQLRGPQFDAAICDELAKWRYAQDTWDMLQFGLRLGDHPQQMITTTPRPIPTLRQIMADPDTVITRGSTFANAANLAPGFIDAIRKRYEGTRLGRQELAGEVLDDVPGALWTWGMIEAARPRGPLPEMQRIVVAVDPSGAGSSDDGSDEIGIIVAGKGIDARAYVLADRTCRLSPAGWGRRVVDAYEEFRADRIVGEANFGGAMVEHVIRTTSNGAAYSEVKASRGKAQRAEPIAALYEQGRVTHAEPFPELETQMTAFTSTGFLGEGSPDRLDAAVWALTDLGFTDYSALDTWARLGG